MFPTNSPLKRSDPFQVKDGKNELLVVQNKEKISHFVTPLLVTQIKEDYRQNLVTFELCQKG